MEPAVLLAIVLPPLAGLLLAIPLFFCCCCCKHKVLVGTLYIYLFTIFSINFLSIIQQCHTSFLFSKRLYPSTTPNTHLYLHLFHAPLLCSYKQSPSFTSLFYSQPSCLMVLYSFCSLTSFSSFHVATFFTEFLAVFHSLDLMSMHTCHSIYFQLFFYRFQRQAPEETLPPPQVVVTLRTGDLDNYSLLSASFRPSTPTPAADNVTRKSLPFSRHPTRTPGLSASECGLGSSEATSTPQDITCFESGRSSALRLDSHPAASAVMTQGFGGSDSSRRRLSVTQHNCSGRQAANTPGAQLDDLQDLSSRPGNQSILGDGRRSSSTSTPGLCLSDLQDLSPRPRDRQSTVGRPSMVVPLHPQRRLAVFQV